MFGAIPLLFWQTTGGGSGSYTLTAAVGGFSVGGATTTLKAARLLSAALGNYTLAGPATGLQTGRKLTAVVGGFTLNGVTTGLLAGRKLITSVGNFNFSGVNVNLIYTPVGSHVMPASVGSFTLAGPTTLFTTARRLTAGVGNFNLTGVTVTLTAGTAVAEVPDYLFGQEPDAQSILGIDLHFRDDSTGDTLTIQLTPSSEGLSGLVNSLGD